MIVYTYAPIRTLGVVGQRGVVHELSTSDLDALEAAGISPTEHMVAGECAWLPPGTPVDDPCTSHTSQLEDLRQHGDQRPANDLGWAPGTYLCSCWVCEKYFRGAKGATTCALCAYPPRSES